MADLTVQEINIVGQVVTFAAASSAGDAFVNDGRTSLRVKNGGVAPITVTIVSQRQCDQGFSHNQAISVAAGETRETGAIDSRFSDTNGKVQVTYSGVSSVTVAAVRQQ